MSWETVVGLEVHARLKTKSKIFSGAATDFGAAPNVNACAVDIALPGVLPVANRAAVEAAIKFGLAVNGKISPVSIFARKNYFYPDLPKGYQISQYEQPVVVGGAVDIINKSVRLTRAHLEEDAGKSVHAANASGIDLNRAGTPLLEIVSEPDIRSADEAVEYARALHALVRWIDVCDGNLQEGSFRVDANVSVRKAGDARLGTRCEIKNLNSFRFLKQAIEFEAARQIDVLESGGRVVLETRLYDPEKNETRAMRTKEEAHDYRYFPDPDLPPLAISAEWVEAVRGKLTELPNAKRARYVAELKLSDYDARVLTSSRASAAYFEAVLRSFPTDPKLASNWITGELSALLNRSELDFDQSPIAPAQLAELLVRIKDGTLFSKTAKQVFDAMAQADQPESYRRTIVSAEPYATRKSVVRGGIVDAIIEAKGLKQVSDTSELERIVAEVIASNPKQVADYQAGKEKLLAFFVGQVMKRTAGRANPTQLNEIVRLKLEEQKR